MSAALTLEQQIAEVLTKHSIDTLQISAVRHDDGSVGFYTAVHDNGLCAFSDLMNLPSMRDAINSGIDAINAKRALQADVPVLASMAEAA